MKGLMKYVNENIAGAKKAMSDFSYARKATKKAKKGMDEVAIGRAKKNYKEKNGTEMTLSKQKMDLESGFLPKATREYIKDKKVIRKDLKKKFKV